MKGAPPLAPEYITVSLPSGTTFRIRSTVIISALHNLVSGQVDDALRDLIVAFLFTLKHPDDIVAIADIATLNDSSITEVLDKLVDDTFRDELVNGAGTNYFERFVNTWKARYETYLRSSIGPLANNFLKLTELSGLTKFTDQLIRMRSTIKAPEFPPLHPEAPNIPRLTPEILQRPEVHHLQELREELAEQAAENGEIQRAMVDSLQEIAMKLAEKSPKSATANHLAWAAVILSALILTATLLTLFEIQL